MAAFDLSGLNAGQREVASRLDGPLFVAAGAGSGKTFTLTARLVHALSEGSAPDDGRYLRSIDEALVITFTEAAALEIKERVRGALRSAGASDPFLREEALKVDGAWISTIHGMCARILRRHAIELGIDPAFKVCVGSVADALMARALDEVMAEVREDSAYEDLREEYPLWSQGRGAHSVVEMVKALRAEASKCVHGFDDFVCPSSHEAADAVARLGSVLEAIASLDLAKSFRETIDASLARITPYLQSAPGQRTAAAACEALTGVKVPALRKAAEKPLREDAERALSEALLAAQYERVQHLAPQLVQLARAVDERYGALKRASSYLDNDDLIALALDAVEGSPEVASDYADRFRLVMIDEFQDTDEKQLRLISLLSGEDACHLTTVGDAQQSIYRFRGGDVSVFRARGRSLPESAHVTMDVNYRSDASVLAVVERTCGDAGLLSDFLRLAGDGGRRQRFLARTEAGEMPPRVRVEVAAGGTSEVMSAMLAAQIADRLAELHDQGQPMGSMALLLGTTTRAGLYLDALRARGLDAVVTGGSTFTSTPEVGVVQALLHTLANPHDTEAGLFRLLSSDMFRLDADDFCQLGTRAQERLDAPTKRAVERCFVEGELELFHDAEPSPRLRAAHRVLSRAFDRLGRWELANVCQAAIEESGWLRRLEEQGVDGMPVAANVLAAVRYVRELVTDLGLGPSRAAVEFDRWLTATKVAPANLVGDDVDAVRVMTIHGSKGLQFGVTAVAECWGKPDSAGKLSLGRIDGTCVVCLRPGAEAGSLSKRAKDIDVPTEARQCASVVEWVLHLDQRELAEQAEEKARLLYVALTRAEEALVVGVPLADKPAYRSALALGFLGAFPELDMPGADTFPEAGEHVIEVAPEQPIAYEWKPAPEADGGSRMRTLVEVPAGVARVVRLTRRGTRADDPYDVSAGGALTGFEGELPQSVTLIPLLGTDRADASRDDPHDAFRLFELANPDLSTYGWRAREDVFSYSSAHALMEERRGARGADEAAPGSGDFAASVDAPPHQSKALSEAQAKRPLAPPRAQKEAEDAGAAFVDDADKATNLGSAFHELAQTMVETGGPHDPARLDALSRYWHLSSRARQRLEGAIRRWESSSVRAEALAYDLMRPEVPFFVQVDSEYGRYVEGAIDLLCCNRGSTDALVVDYKTGDVGLTYEQIRARHEMQANFYAHVMMSQGYKTVTCAFVCVECDRGDGEPVVVRYGFDEEVRPEI